MTKLDSASCSDGAAYQNTVFIDTSLDTHLAMAVFDGDTVSDLKQKIEKEHPLCFPHVGNIKIHALKVKRKGFFYHLSDNMYLKSAFVGVDKSWFLFIDASSANDHSTERNNGDLSTNFGMAINTSVDGINHARSSQLGQIPNRDVVSLRDNVTQQDVNEKAPSDNHFGYRHSSKKDLITKKAEVRHSVENCSKVQSGARGNGRGDHKEPSESLPTVNVNHKSKKQKSKLMNKRALELDNGQNPLQQDVGSREKVRDCACEDDSDLPMVENQPNADEPCRSLSSNTRNESEYGLKGKFQLSEETELPCELDGKNDKSKTEFHLTHYSSLEVAKKAGPAANKIGEINGVKDSLEGNRDLVSDSNKVTSKLEVTSDYLSENIQTAKVILDGFSTEPDAHLLEAGSSDAKGKKKKAKSLDFPNQVVGLISSRARAQEHASRVADVTTVPSHDVEDASICKLAGMSAREKHDDSNHETAENFASSPVGRSCNSDLDDVKGMEDASDKAVSRVNRTTDSEDPAFISNDDPSNLHKRICTSEDANYIQSNHLTCKTGQTVAVLEERDSMQNADIKVVEKCHSSIGEGAYINTKATEISESPHLKGTSKTTKCSKNKKTRKHKDSVDGRHINLVATGARDSVHGTLSTDLHGVDGDNSSSKVEIEESNISLMKGENTIVAPVLFTDMNMELDETNRSKVEPLLQINKTKAGTENIDEPVRKKLKKRPVTSMKSLSDVQTKGLGNKDSSPSKRSNVEVKSVFKTKSKPNLPKLKSRNEIEDTNLDTARLFEVESNPPSIQTNSRIVGSSVISLHASEGNLEERPLEANIYSNTSKDCMDKVDKPVEVSCESSKIDIEEKAGQLQHESVEKRSDKFIREKSASNLLKAKRKKNDLNVCSSEASLSLHYPLKSDENGETERCSETSNSISLKLQGSSSKDKCNEMLHFDNKVKKISKDGVKSRPSNKHKQHMSNSDKDRVRANAVDTSGNGAEKNSEAFSVSRKESNLKNSKSMVHEGKKHMGHQSMEIERRSSRSGKRHINRLEQKNLLATSEGIFKDASSDSTENEDGIADSDASTRSPYDSLSSDFSDDERIANMKSSKKGSIDSGRKSIRGRSIRKIGSSSPERMSLDTILRSSSRYKKAKLTAAQSQLDDTESKPVDFAPDSQA